MRSTGLAIVLGLCACATPGREAAEAPRSVPGVDGFVVEVSDVLIDTASQRVDVSRVRLAIAGIDELSADSALASANDDEARRATALGEELERQFLVSLTQVVNVLDRESDASEGVPPGASHALVGEIERKGQSFLLSLRVVDTRTQVVIAAARRTVVMGELGDWTRSALLRRSAPIRLVTAETPMPSTGADAALDGEGVETTESTQVAEAAPAKAPPTEARPMGTQPESSAPSAGRRTPVPRLEPVPTPLPYPGGPAAQRLRSVGRGLGSGN